MKNYTFNIDQTTVALPQKWDEIATENIFLQKKYLAVLEQSAPENMKCFYISMYKNNDLVGVAMAQYIDASKIESFNGKTMFCGVRQFFVNKFSAHVLFMGNNMLTGYNSFVFNGNENKLLQLLKNAKNGIVKLLKTENKRVNLCVFKDFYQEHTQNSDLIFKDYFKFTTQPNMVFKLDKNWKTEADYKGVLVKKYRQQHNRARNKTTDIVKRRLSFEEIKTNEERLYELYLNVVKNAPFNTFFLTKNHFSILKENLGDAFLLYGYFTEEKLIGFNTLIKNGAVMETYFLGYDDTIQKEKMLYLNMLFDMVSYSINKQFKKIIFGRTALEIKSSVGAEPIITYGYIKHENRLINTFLPAIFKQMNPTVEWQKRSPFAN